MATTTPRIGLTKPDGTDLVDIAVLNTNFDKIDSNIASTKIQSTKPTTANAGDLWWDSDTGTLYLYYVDANSSQWVAATSDPINIGVVANQTERDAQYPTPAQGMSVYRTDLGVTQRYYGLFNSSTNPGGRDTAGWYNTEKSVGLVPIQPTTVTAVTGTATANSLGQVTFSGCTAVSLNGVFSSEYKNYRFIVNITASSVSNAWVNLRGLSGATELNSNVWFYSTYRWAVGSVTTTWSRAQSAESYLMVIGSAGGSSSGDIYMPNEAVRTYITASSSTNYDAEQSVHGSQYADLSQWTGIKIFPSGGNFTGSIQILAYND